MRIIAGILFSSIFLAVQACPGASLRVGVSVLPLESIVAEIGGDAVEVRSLQQEGDSCSVFEPRPSSITWLSTATLFFRTGVGYESSILGKVQSRFPGLKVLDLREAVETEAYQDGHGHDHRKHGEGSDHDEETDPHLWLDPVRLADMGDWIALHLIEALPSEAEEIRTRAAAFRARVGALDAELANLLAPFRGRSFYIYHPALNYFANRYGLRQVALSGPASPPGARELHQLVGQAQSEGVRTIFVQPQESRRHAETMARAIGAEIVEIDPMARDWQASLWSIGRALARSFDSQ